MPAPTIADLRGAVVDALAGVTGWTESRWTYDQFGSDSNQLMPRSFAVSCTESNVGDPGRAMRRMASEPGIWMETRIRARWAHRLRADAQRADLGTAYTEERVALAAVAGADVEGIGPIRPVRIVRVTDGDGTWHLTDVEWRCSHLYQIAEV